MTDEQKLAKRLLAMANSMRATHPLVSDLAEEAASALSTLSGAQQEAVLNAGHIGDFVDEYADRFGVERFQAAMLTKLAKKRHEGRGGWNRENECRIGYLRQLLAEHVDKGDPVDIANFCMMIWNRENPTAKPAAHPNPSMAAQVEGMVLVPIEPTEEMLRQADSNWSGFCRDGAGEIRKAAARLYRAMIAAIRTGEGRI